MNIIRLILSSLRWRLVYFFAGRIKKAFILRNNNLIGERIIRALFSFLNTEKFNIDMSSDVLARFDESAAFFMASRKSILEREIATTGNFYLIDFASPLIKDNNVCLDVGSNSGVFSVALGLRHPSAHFYCFEPHPELINRLKINIALNKLENVQPVEMAVSDNDECVTLLSQDLSISDNWGLSSTVYSPAIGKHSRIKVKAVTCDTFKKNNFPKKKVCFIKIDVQGAEINVLKGAATILSEDRPIIVFEHEDEFFENPANAKNDIRSLLNKFDYEAFILSKRFKNMFFPVDWNAAISVDLIAIPKFK